MPSKGSRGEVHILWWGDIKDTLHPLFKLSPVAMIPHKSRLFRAILDLSFYLRQKGAQYKSVNDTTTKVAPKEAMKRIIVKLADAQEEDKELFFVK
jgi:hypothetical protein